MREFSVGGVLGRVVALFRAQPGLLIGLTALFVALPQTAAAVALVLAHPLGAGFASIPFAAYWLGSLLLEGAVIRAATASGSGRPPRFGGLLGTAARFFFPILAITILASIVTGLASVLLVIPGVMLFCRWFVAVPAAVAEGCGITASFGRSGALTKGVRWRVFGTVLVMGVLNFVITFALGFLGGFVARFVGATWPTLTGSVLGTSISMLIACLFYTATYLELREIREGVMSDEMVSVFN